MRARLAVLAAVAIGATLHSSAYAAAPRKTCNLVKDAAGDVSTAVDGGIRTFPDDPGFDLAGADLASNAAAITAVIKLHAEPGTATAYRKDYLAVVRVAGLANPLVLIAKVTPTETVYGWGRYDYDTTAEGYEVRGTATGSISGKVVTITASLDAIAGQVDLGRIKKNAKVSDIRIFANRTVPPLSDGLGTYWVADEALGGRAVYYASAPSCVRVGG